MKKYILLLLAVFALFGCEDLEENSPAMQAELDLDLYRSIDAKAQEDADGGFVIQGVTDDETLTLRVSSGAEGTYILGGESANYGIFENMNSHIYVTNPYGSGEVTISRWDQTNQTLSGSFNFEAVRVGIDTLNVGKGIFYQVPYGNGLTTDPTTGEPTGPSSAGTFVAQVDGNPFNPFEVTAAITGNNIVISGSTTSISVTISMPLDIEPGSNALPQAGFTAKYTDDTGTQNAISGTIIVISHDQTTNIIKGTFSFETPFKSVTLGQFNVVYQ